jgi:hypothetical protein
MKAAGAVRIIYERSFVSADAYIYERSFAKEVERGSHSFTNERS